MSDALAFRVPCLQWGAVEREPRMYNWQGYKQLFEMLRPTGLKVQTVLAFHACGGNVGDLAQVPLPAWVQQVRRCGTFMAPPPFASTLALFASDASLQHHTLVLLPSVKVSKGHLDPR